MDSMIQKIKKILIAFIILLSLFVLVGCWWVASTNVSTINSKKVGELTEQINEVTLQQNNCLNNLTYEQSIENYTLVAKHCNEYSEQIMELQAEIDEIKANDLTQWQPWELTADGSHQLMPSVNGDDSHERFKELVTAYGLDPSVIREVENKRGIKEGVIACITVSETSGGTKGYAKDGCNNVGNVGNNDRGNRVCYSSLYEGLDKIGATLNNQYLGNIGTLGCLSNAGSCKNWDNNTHRYATSNGNWQRNMVACLSTIYGGEIDPATFIIRR